MSNEPAPDPNAPPPTQSPFADSPAADADVAAAPAAPAGPGRWGLILAVVGLALTVALAGAGFLAWQHLQGQQQAAGQRLQAQLDRSLQDLHRDAGRLEANLGERLTALDRRQRDLAEQQTDLAEGLDRARVFSVRGTAGWALAEVAYLLRIANHRLRLQHDPKIARIALRAADARLRDLADPALTPVRRELAQEIAALENLPDPDLEGLALRLDGLAAQIADLPQRHAMLDGDAPAAEPHRPAAVSDTTWEQALDMAWTDLKDLVRVRRHDQPVQALLTPKERFFLYQNLRLRLNAARLHLLDRNAAALRADLDQARALLARYFDPQHTGVQNALAELKRIAVAPIAPPLPDISGSLAVLRRVTAELAAKRDAAEPASAAPTTPITSMDVGQ